MYVHLITLVGFENTEPYHTNMHEFIKTNCLLYKDVLVICIPSCIPYTTVFLLRITLGLMPEKLCIGIKKGDNCLDSRVL